MWSREVQYEVALVTAVVMMLVGLVGVGVGVIFLMALVSAARLWQKVKPRAIRRWRDAKWWLHTNIGRWKTIKP